MLVYKDIIFILIITSENATSWITVLYTEQLLIKHTNCAILRTERKVIKYD